MADVTLSTAEIRDWETFHDICARDFEFPDFYGRNINAWIDCLTYVREGDGMSRFILQEGEYLYIHLSDFVTFSQREPVICLGMMECVAFVNTSHKAPCLGLILE